MTTREVIIKDDSEQGFVYGRPIWESDTTEYGVFARLDRAHDGRMFVSITDMETHDTSWQSAPVSPANLAELAAALLSPVRPDGDVTITEEAVDRATRKLWELHHVSLDFDDPRSDKFRELYRRNTREVLAAAHDRPGGEE